MDPVVDAALLEALGPPSTAITVYPAAGGLATGGLAAGGLEAGAGVGGLGTGAAGAAGLGGLATGIGGGLLPLALGGFLTELFSPGKSPLSDLLGTTAKPSVADVGKRDLINAYLTAGGPVEPGRGPPDIRTMLDYVRSTAGALPGNVVAALNSVGIDPSQWSPIGTAAAAEAVTPPVDITKTGVPSPGGAVDTTRTYLPTYGRELDAATARDLAAARNLDATTLPPAGRGALIDAFRSRGIGPLDSGGAAAAPATTAASVATGANPNVPSALQSPASSTPIANIADVDPNSFAQIKENVLGRNVVELPGASPSDVAPTPPKSGGGSDFFKEYGPYLAGALGAGGLLYGLNKQNAAKSDQQAQAGLLNRVAGNIQSGVIDPTNTALAGNELIAKGGLVASQDIERANPLLDIFQTGKLPPAMQAMYDQALADANASSKSRLAGMGIGLSTMTDELLNANKLRNLAQQGSAYQDLYNLGLKTQQQGLNITNDMIRNILTGSSGQTTALTGAGGIYNDIAKQQIAADKELVEALAKFATMLNKAGASSGAPL
jgi:hypothetical protein